MAYHNHEWFCSVSIPQAVSTIAITAYYKSCGIETEISFNTASGKYYCNKSGDTLDDIILKAVSIPQAVSTIAMGLT